MTDSNEQKTASKRFCGWWVQYPEPSRTIMISEPLKNSLQMFQIGDDVRLNGKPDRVRKVLAVEWHRHRYEFVYVVTVSKEVIFGYHSSPYWFASQLSLATKKRPAVS